MVLVGLATWSLETEYGGNAVAGSTFSGDLHRVFDVVEGEIDVDGHPVTTIVFEGTEAEANAYMERRWREGRNYTIPAVVITGGVVIVLGGLVAPLGSRAKRSDTD